MSTGKGDSRGPWNEGNGISYETNPNEKYGGPAQYGKDAKQLELKKLVQDIMTTLGTILNIYNQNLRIVIKQLTKANLRE